ncbi:SH3 domain-containing protein [Colletotrichum scovillei]|uniref:SH3 domain-containing protein n=1 Tax=Colletotrichum scovillei TaxID=1209932 RepID=A0A9P7UHD1_9PEZI|nr:SH3 domain-containing protein [Colletotrichum scovillei]KAF4773454.1 SH3 domain-containing protein [Colletotrichum scovillei]KAG7048700.1 SH3 domain-containing protein [Colletotrichum scovillei]KAG7065864.1 SH3 domain-containing protein [Colletotrichum scovillei]KAG7068467.1 SH3 domain-containing protein [Colletotrichum scovillei]
MDVVKDLVTGPFEEVVEKGTVALGNAGDDRDMLSESQKLVKGAERILKIIEPLCLRHLEESGVNFIDALKDDNEIADYRSQMTDMIWDFEDVIDADTYEKEKYVELRELCKRAGLRTGEILKRMRLEPAPREQPPIPIIATSPPATHETQDQGHGSLPTSHEGHHFQPYEEQHAPPEPESRVREEVIELQPPPPPPTNPWSIGASPMIETGLEGPMGEMNIERRPPVSMSSPISEPGSPKNMSRLSHGSDHRLEIPTDRVLSEEDRYHQMSPQDLTRSPVSMTDRNHPLVSRGRASSTTLGIVTEDQTQTPRNVNGGHSPRPHRHSQTSSMYSHASRQRSQESLHDSVFDGGGGRRNSGAISPSMTEHRASTSSAHDGGRLSPTSRPPIIPPNFPPGVHEGIEKVPLVMSDGEGLIPVESESSSSQGREAALQVSSRPKDCNIGLSSSFYLYKGFCEGAKEVTRGGLGVKKVKKPGFSGAHEVAKCSSCSYELDFKQVENDVNNAEEANHTSNKISYRPRFLQKSHVATKRADEFLYGCVFCVHAQRTLEECDATVFFSQKKLFEHLARHPRPLPQVPGITVVETSETTGGGEVPLHLRNNYDLHFRAPPRPSRIEGRQLELAQLPTATATQTVKRMYGMRLLYDNTPGFELANGARLSGVEFPAKYNGEWVMGWHEGNFGSAPLDVLKLEAPPKAEIRADTASNISAVARWKFAPRPKDGGDWLKFDQGERITNISWAWQDHWCWSGTNAKGVWGIFPQTFIDAASIREVSDRSSISSGERRKSGTAGFFERFSSGRKASRQSSVGHVMVSSGPRPSVV